MNPDQSTRRVANNGASGEKAGQSLSAEPPNTGQRHNRLPVGSSSPSTVADETGRFDKKQRKRARRRKNGKPAGADCLQAAAPTAARIVTRKTVKNDARLRHDQSSANSTLNSGQNAGSNANISANISASQGEEQPVTQKTGHRRKRARRKKNPLQNAVIAQSITQSAPQSATKQAGAHTASGAQPANGQSNGQGNCQTFSKTNAVKTEPHAQRAHSQQNHSKANSNHYGHKQPQRGIQPREQHREQQREISARLPVTPRATAYEPALYAALDLGTNNCRLLIATPSRPGQFRVVDSFSRIVRLGEGFGTSGRLSDQAMHRAIEALKICRDKLDSKNIRRRRLIATEACRSASNGKEFLERVRVEAGLELEIVDRQTEASLAVSGCGTLINRETDALVLFDIGGGSSEIALIDVTCRRSARLAEHITAWTSLPVGVVTLAEKFGGRDVTPENYAEMVAHVAGLLNEFSERFKLGDLTKSAHFHLLGTSGTVTTLAGIHLGLDRYDRRRVDGMWMGAQDVTAMTEKLLSWDFKARVANPCIGADRADLVLAGCAILDAIRQIWPSERLLVADRGLREGILTELMSRDGAWRHRRPHAGKETYIKKTSQRDSQAKGRQS